mgnify:CR=1 FL=1
MPYCKSKNINYDTVSDVVRKYIDDYEKELRTISRIRKANAIKSGSFTEEYQKLHKKQKEAVDATDDPVMVAKTETPPADGLPLKISR